MQIKQRHRAGHWACRSNTPLSIRLHLTLVRIEAIKLRLPLNLPLISDLIWHGLGSRILAHSTKYSSDLILISLHTRVLGSVQITIDSDSIFFRFTRVFRLACKATCNYLRSRNCTSLIQKFRCSTDSISLITPLIN